MQVKSVWVWNCICRWLWRRIITKCGFSPSVTTLTDTNVWCNGWDCRGILILRWYFPNTYVFIDRICIQTMHGFKCYWRFYWDFELNLLLFLISKSIFLKLLCVVRLTRFEMHFDNLKSYHFFFLAWKENAWKSGALSIPFVFSVHCALA